MPLLQVAIVASVVIFIAVAGYLVYFISRYTRRGKLRRALGMRVFLIRLPRYEREEEELQRDPREFIGEAEQLHAQLARIKAGGWLRRTLLGPPPVSFEIASEAQNASLGFYIAVPRASARQLEKAVHGVYPDAQVEEVPNDYNIFMPDGASAVSRLLLEESNYLPIATYEHLESDPLNTVATAVSQVGENEGAAVQIVTRPASGKWKQRGQRILSRLRQGETLKDAARAESHDILGGVFGGSGKRDDEEPRPPVDEERVEGVQSKLRKTPVQANIRLVASAQTEAEADGLLGELEGAFDQFAAASWNGFAAKRQHKRKRKKALYNFAFREFNPKTTCVLNTAELASLYHLSLSKLEVPNLQEVRSRETPIPQNLPAEGMIALGKASYRGEEQTVQFADRDDRRRHVYAIGQTGTGKSSLFQEMIRQDIEAGEGVGVVDPHGDLIEATLANIPKERAEDVVLFEPADMERPAGLNMLEWDTPDQKDFAVQEMIAIFQKLFPPEVIGPMFEHYMRNAMLALMADQDNPGTLVEIPRIFTDEEFMDERIKAVEDPVVRRFWEKEWKQTTGQTKSDMRGYVVSKLGRFVENEMLRNIIGQSRSAFNMQEVMDEGKIFLANLSKGKTGEVNASLLGLILVSKLQMAAFRRADYESEEARRDFYLYVDEFQNFTTDSVATILSEARKYRLNLNITHQFIQQLADNIRDAVFGNVGTMISFRVSSEDGEVMEKQFEPEFTRHDLVNLDNFNAVVKLMVDGQATQPFRMQTIPPQNGNPEQVDSLKRMAKLKHSRPREEVEEEIRNRAQL